jgi:hypothetical protein
MSDSNSKTALINRALSFLGEQRITNTDNPETKAGRAMVDNYDACREETLRRVAWNFAESWAEINYFNPAPLGFDYADTYELPEDFIRLIEIPGQQVSGVFFIPVPIRDFRFITMDGTRLIAIGNNAASTLNIAYTANIDDLNLWDPLAKKVFATILALDLSVGITGKAVRAQQLEAMLTLDLQDAAGINGNEQRKGRTTYSLIQRERETAFLGNVSWFTPVTGYPSS